MNIFKSQILFKSLKTDPQIRDFVICLNKAKSFIRDSMYFVLCSKTLNFAVEHLVVPIPYLKS